MKRKIKRSLEINEKNLDLVIRFLRNEINSEEFAKELGICPIRGKSKAYSYSSSFLRGAYEEGLINITKSKIEKNAKK